MQMEQRKQLEILRELLRQIEQQVNVDAGEQLRNPTQVYTCPEIAAREWQRLFRGHPQLIGLTSDLPENDSYLTSDDFGVPLLATRDETGRFRAFVNACRHRGARVAGEHRGRSARFTCPFHAWTYSRAGELLRIPRAGDFGPVDTRCHGLLELPAVEYCGMLWVHPQPGARLDIAALLGSLGAELTGWDIDQWLYQGESTIDMPLNWKLANDTFGETYHFSRLHRNTLGQLFVGDVLAWEPIGRNHRFVIANRDIMGLRERPEADWRLLDVTLLVYFLFPNVQLTVNRIGGNLVRIYPDPRNPGRSITRISHYLRPEVVAALAQSDKPRVDASNAYDLEARRGTNLINAESSREIFRSTIEQEDYAMGVAAQRAADCGLLEDVIFGRNEPALHHFHRGFREVLGMPALQPPAGAGTAARKLGSALR
jgi:phenylpropionate dioxygenase-like ring-hydroxylating dioxygenase large terminal subunit